MSSELAGAASHAQYRREIDGLRAVAVVSVILWHAGFASVSGGFAGVDVFFVVSGFLITAILYGDLSRERFSFRRFYERRVRRILPALVFIVAATFPFVWAWALPDAFESYSRSIVSVVFFVSNLFFWRSSDYFGVDAEQMPLLHTWSLSVEEQFYVLFPVLLLVLWKLSRKKILPILVVMACASFVLGEWGHRYEPVANFFLAPTRAWELLAGAVASVFTFQRPSKPRELPAALGLAMMLLSFFVYDESTPFPSAFALLPVMGTVLVLLFGRAGTATAAILSTRPIVGIGLISYSAYLWHQPLFVLARMRLLTDPSPPIMLALCVLSLALAAFSWKFVEQPFRRPPSASAAPSARPFAMAAAGSAVLVAIAMIGVVSHGAKFRFNESVISMLARFDQEKAARRKNIHADECQFNEQRTGVGVDGFLERWTCEPKAGDGMIATDIAIFGDSHSADIAEAMRANGGDVMQIGGANCSLTPELMSADCRKIARFIKQKIVAVGITRLWLANRYFPPELTPAAIRSMIEFWKIDGVAVSVFSPMPEYRNLRDVAAKSVWLGIAMPLTLDSGANQRFMAAELKDLFTRSSVGVLDSKKLFCAASPGCAAFAGTTPLMTDGQHLSTEGAQRFGRALVEELSVQ